MPQISPKCVCAERQCGRARWSGIPYLVIILASSKKLQVRNFPKYTRYLL